MNLYERYLKYLNKNGKFFDNTDINLSYLAWFHLKKEPLENVNILRKEFLEDSIEGEGDVLDRILKNNIDTKAYIEFLYSDLDLYNILINIEDENKSRDIKAENILLDKYANRKSLNKILNISISNNIKIQSEISYIDKKNIRMYYFKGLAVFITIGIDYKNDDIVENNDLSKYLSIFKALSVESRLQIVKELLFEELTTSELSQRLNISLSTVNHHLKSLIEVGIVGLQLESKSGKGACYKLNKDIILEILAEIENKLKDV